MENEPTKYCTTCGKEISSNADFCSYCGSKQQSVEKNDIQQPLTEKENSVTENTPSSSDSQSKGKWYQTKGGKILAFALVVFGIIVIAGIMNGKKNPNTNDIAKDIQSNVFDGQEEDYGKAKIKFDDESGFLVDLPKDSNAINQLEEGYTANWNSLVSSLEEESKSISEDYNNADADLSYIQVLVPGDSDHVLLEVDKGKVKYDKADDFN
ncbi:zinc-ribbon domain-containing protein [Lentilactobacillus senioris]|uniref:zinc ribbon domain-containing protein n=1 Tax=Lentilactobacillus senioris TaxID=931534 RepID=UPI003D2DABEF